MNLPSDIIQETKRKFPKKDIDSILELFQKIKSDTLNVGPDQLIRCMILLSEGNFDKLSSIRAKRYWGDPRDVIRSANDKFKDCNSGLKKFQIPL